MNILNKANEGLAGSDGTISIKIVREGGENVQEYKGPNDADGIVTYVKRQYGPASVEISTLEDAQNFISDNKIAIVSNLFSSYFVPTWSSSWNFQIFFTCRLEYSLNSLGRSLKTIPS